MSRRVTFWTALASACLLAAACGANRTQTTSPRGDDLPAYTSPAGQSVEVVGATDDELVLVDWAFGRFAAAGLVEPTVERIDFASTHPRCDGSWGVALSGDDRAEIAVCADVQRICPEDPEDTGEIRFTLTARLCLLHELSHLWLAHHTLDPVRAAFLDHTGAASWRDPDDPWAERGVEQAADTMAWGLLGETIEILGRPLPPCDQLDGGFTILTGVAPTSRCPPLAPR